MLSPASNAYSISFTDFLFDILAINSLLILVCTPHRNYPNLVSPTGKNCSENLLVNLCLGSDDPLAQFLKEEKRQDSTFVRGALYYYKGVFAATTNVIPPVIRRVSMSCVAMRRWVRSDS